MRRHRHSNTDELGNAKASLSLLAAIASLSLSMAIASLSLSVAIASLFYSLSDGDTFFRFLGVFFDAKASSSSLLSEEDSISLYETLPAGRFRDLPPPVKLNEMRSLLRFKQNYAKVLPGPLRAASRS